MVAFPDISYATSQVRDAEQVHDNRGYYGEATGPACRLCQLRAEVRAHRLAETRQAYGLDQSAPNG